MVEKI